MMHVLRAGICLAPALLLSPAHAQGLSGLLLSSDDVANLAATPAPAAPTNRFDTLLPADAYPPVAASSVASLPPAPHALQISAGIAVRSPLLRNPCAAITAELVGAPDDGRATTVSLSEQGAAAQPALPGATRTVGLNLSYLVPAPILSGLSVAGSATMAAFDAGPTGHDHMEMASLKLAF